MGMHLNVGIQDPVGCFLKAASAIRKEGTSLKKRGLWKHVMRLCRIQQQLRCDLMLMIGVLIHAFQGRITQAHISHKRTLCYFLRSTLSLIFDRPATESRRFLPLQLHSIYKLLEYKMDLRRT